MPKQISNFFKQRNHQLIFLFFILWKVYLFFCVELAFLFVPLFSKNFLGGGIKNYQNYPQVFSWLNFDGEHYLSIAINGYKSLEHAFFPGYPFLIHSILNFFPKTFLATAIIGLIISNISFLLSLFILFHLIKKQFSQNVALVSVIAILLFPTSFYFQAFYSESLFLLLIVLTFFFANQKKWWLVGITGMLASFSRVFGVLLLPSIVTYEIKNKETWKQLIPILLIPLGLFIYIIYLWRTTGDPLAFYNLQLIVGEQHQRGIVLYPQILYRYFKIFTDFHPSEPIYYTYILEVFSGVLFLILPLIGYFKKLNRGYLFFSLSALLLPTLQGSFSSLPRYVLILFPSFVVLSILVLKIPRFIQACLILISMILLGLETMLFVRGYWIA